MKFIASNQFKLIVILFTLNVASCIPNEQAPCTEQHTYHYLTQEQINKTPYFTNPAFDTISFASSTGDTLTFALQKIDTTWYTEDINTNPDGCSKWQHYIKLVATYKSLNNDIIFRLTHSMYDLAKHQSNNTWGYNFLDVTFNSIEFIIYIDDLGKIFSPTYLGVFYQDSRKYDFSNFIINKKIEPDSGYINSEFGIFRIFEYSHKKVWKLLNY